MKPGRRLVFRMAATVTVAALAADVMTGCGRAAPPAHALAQIRSAAPTPPPRPPTAPAPAAVRPAPLGHDGLPEVLSQIKTTDKVVFITVDDGWQKDPGFVKLIRDRKIPITVFLMNDAAKENYGYFRQLQQAGALIEDHTLIHPVMTRLSYAQQKYQICHSADLYAQQYGVRPTLFRAPYGLSNNTTRRAAKACGMRALFFWKETARGTILYQVPGGLHPGDVILVHFLPHMTRNFLAMLKRIEKQGFTPAAFKDYLPAGYFQQ
jgi:peptidoglycan/xylan/chitin deacetylase (PgdA/CDA1 family)